MEALQVVTFPFHSCKHNHCSFCWPLVDILLMSTCRRSCWLGVKGVSVFVSVCVCVCVGEGGGVWEECLPPGPFLTYLLTYAHRSQWSIGHQRPPGHRTLFWAALVILDQLVPCCFSSASVSRLQLLWGRPLFLFPCLFQVRAWCVVLDAGFLRVSGPFHIYNFRFQQA